MTNARSEQPTPTVALDDDMEIRLVMANGAAYSLSDDEAQAIRDGLERVLDAKAACAIADSATAAMIERHQMDVTPYGDCWVVGGGTWTRGEQKTEIKATRNGLRTAVAQVSTIADRLAREGWER